MLGQLLWVLGSDELLIVWGADVDKGPYGLGRIGGLERSVVYRVAVDFADVEVLLDLGNVLGPDSVGDAPNAVRG